MNISQSQHCHRFPIKILQKASSIRLVFSGEVSRLVGNVVARAEDENLHPLGSQLGETRLSPWGDVETGDTLNASFLSSKTILESESIEANFEIR